MGWEELSVEERKGRALDALMRDFSFLKPNGRLPRTTAYRILDNLGLWVSNMPPYVRGLPIEKES